MRPTIRIGRDGRGPGESRGRTALVAVESGEQPTRRSAERTLADGAGKHVRRRQLVILHGSTVISTGFRALFSFGQGRQGGQSCIVEPVSALSPPIAHTKTKAECMSRRNGDRARFQKERKRKMLRRQRVQEFIKAGAAGTD